MNKPDVDAQITTAVVQLIKLGRKVEPFNTVQIEQDGPMLMIEARHINAAKHINTDANSTR